MLTVCRTVQYHHQRIFFEPEDGRDHSIGADKISRSSLIFLVLNHTEEDATP